MATVKSETRDLIRALIVLVEKDVSELADSLAEVDERCSRVVTAGNENLEWTLEKFSDHSDRFAAHDKRIAELEAALADVPLSHAVQQHVAELSSRVAILEAQRDNANHSRKVEP